MFETHKGLENQGITYGRSKELRDSNTVNQVGGAAHQRSLITQPLVGSL